MNSDRAWEKFGQISPYFGVLSHERFQGRTIDGDARAEFFASGAAQVKDLLQTVRTHLAPDFTPRRALDFGCGVGRITIPLAREVDQVVGMDISPSMLGEAARNCEAEHVGNVQLVPSDDELTQATGRFDLVHSYIVFQHIAPARGERIFRAMLDRLEEGGIGVAHFTFAKRLPAWRRWAQTAAARIPYLYSVTNLLRGRAFSYPLMQMNRYDLNRLFTILMDGKCHEVYTLFSDHGGHLGVVLYFRKGARASK